MDNNHNVLQIDRTVPLSYPENVSEALYNESIGPVEVSLAEAERWLHDGQKNGVVEGTVIHDCLVNSDRIKSCYGLRELLAIQAKGIAYFREHFKGKSVYAWRGVVKYDDLGYEELRVPCLVGDVGKIIWTPLEDRKDSHNLTLLYPAGT